MKETRETCKSLGTKKKKAREPSETKEHLQTRTAIHMEHLSGEEGTAGN